MKRGERATRTMVLIAVAVFSLSALFTIPEKASAYTLHTPIYINGDADFIEENGVTGGSGTLTDPYIIEGWEIDASLKNGTEIRNTNAYFVIRSVYVHSNGANSGIYLKNVINGRVENSVISNLANGIYLDSSIDTTIANNTVSSAFYHGILLDYSINITVAGNSLSDNNYALGLRSSTNVTVTANIVRNNGAGMYVVSTTSVLISANNVSNNDMNAPPDGYGMYLLDTANVTVVDNTVSRNRHHGIWLFSSANATITSNAVTSNGGTGIFLEEYNNATIGDNNILDNAYGVSLSRSSNVTITSNTIASSKERGIYLSFSTYVTIANNVFTSNGVSIFGTILPEFNSHTIMVNNLVNGKPLYYYKNCTGLDINAIPVGQLIAVNCSDIKVANLRITDTDMGIEMAFVDGVLIMGNDLFSARQYGVHLLYSANATISGNNLTSNKVGMYLLSVVNATIVGNNVTTNGEGGVYLSSTTVTTISGNSLSSNGKYGIYLVSSTSATISSNSVSFSDDKGIDIWSSSNVILTDNNIFSNGVYGVYLYNSADVSLTSNDISNHMIGAGIYSSVNTTVASNNLSSSGQYGIHLFSSTKANITSNLITANSLGGVVVESATSANITRNSVWNNGGGLRLYSSTGILVYYNHFIRNGVQASDDRGSENSWDNGHPTGGNYWSDHAGADNCSGPNQDVCPDPDGIGDTPYIIDADSRDRYPLIEPIVAPNAPPVASFTISPSSGDVTTTFAVNASSSWDPEDPMADLNIRWDWEDDDVWDILWSINRTAQHRYPVPGNYTIRLETKDAAGLISSTSTRVTVGPDRTPPQVVHTPPGEVRVGQTITIAARVTDAGGVGEVLLYYESVGEATFTALTMILSGGETYRAEIPAQAKAGEVAYYIVATDNAGNAAREPETGQHTIAVRESPGGLDPMLTAFILVAAAAAVVLLYLLFRKRRPVTSTVPPAGPPM